MSMNYTKDDNMRCRERIICTAAAAPMNIPSEVEEQCISSRRRRISVQENSSSCRWRLYYSSLMLASIIIAQVAASTTAAGGGGGIAAVDRRKNDRHRHSSTIPLSFIVKKRHPKQSQQQCPSQIMFDSSSVSLGFWLRSQDDMYVELGSTDEEKATPLSSSSVEHQLSASDDTELSSETIDAGGGEAIVDFGNEEYVSLSEDNFLIVKNSTINTDTNTKPTSRRWKRLSSLSSSVSNTLILPGTPLFLRLLPVKPSEVISKIIDEMPLPPRDHEEEEDEEEETSPETTAALAMFGAAPSELRRLVLAAPNVDTIVNENVKASNEEEKGDEEEVPQDPTNNVESDVDEKDVPEAVSDKKTKAGFFRRRKRSSGRKNTKGNAISKEELQCPAIVTNIHEMREAVLINGTSLRDVGFRFPLQGIGSDIVLENDADTSTLSSFSNQTMFQRHDPTVNGTLSSLLNCNAASAQNKSDFQLGIELINQHNVLELIKERVRTNSTPGDRQTYSPDDESIPHLALVIEGGGMRGAVSAGMAAALSTLDLLDAFDSVHGSSAGAIVGAYLVSRQLCTDIYTDIMPKAGSKFASTRRGMLNFGVDYLSDLIERKLLISSPSTKNQPLLLPTSEDDDAICLQMDNDHNISDSDAWLCDESISSVEMAMGRIKVKQPRSLLKNRWADDHYDGVMLESMDYLMSGANSFAQRTVSKPLSFGVRRFGRALRPALDALDFASAMRQYLRRRPGMNLTFVLDGIMDDTHGLRPFDIDAFRANDKRQPLYVISSAVTNGGSGDMETIAFNAEEGDFFGFNDDSDKGSESNGKGRVSWYRRLWNVVKTMPLVMFSAVRKSLFASDVVYESPLPPPGTNAMYGFVNRNKKKRTKRKQEEKIVKPTGRMDDEGKSGIYPCLEASALVPGAAGPPLQLIRSKNRKNVEEKGRFPRWRSGKELNRRKEQNSHLCFDAFCYEPIPYRSAVEKAGATHVLALRSRPDGCVVETKQHMYEKIVAPIYFRQNGMKQVAKWFAGGGSQYRYIEDVLTLEEGLARGIALGQNSTNNQDYLQGVKIPPTKILYGSDDAEPVTTEIEDWKRAHLLPITLPFGTPELPALSQDKDEVILAVRHGYAAAYDILAPIAGLPFDSATITGERVAELLFPLGEDDVDVLDKRVKIKSSYIGMNENEEELKRRSFAAWITGKREAKRKVQETMASHPDGLLARQAKRRYHESDQYLRDGSNTLEYIEIEALLAALPGFRGGRLDHISDNLKKGKSNSSAGL